MNIKNSKGPRVAVIVDGGIVQGIVTDNKNLEGMDFMVIDYDTDGVEDTIKIFQGEPYNDFSEAYVTEDKVSRSVINLSDIHEAFNAYMNEDENNTMEE